MIHNENISIGKALKELEKAKYKCLIFTDNEKKFSGTLTDGDLRRAILKGAKFNDRIKKYLFKNSYFIRDKDFSKTKIDKVFKNKKLGIEAIPILNKSKKVIRVIYPNKKIFQTNTKKYNNSIVIMAGGMGKRLEPFTSILPKPLAPINNKTLIEHIMSNFKDYNLNKFFVTINYKKEIIKAYFKDNNNYKIYFLEEKKPKGTAGSLRLLKNKVSSDFIVTNCDILVDINFHHLLDFHKKNKFDFTLIASKKKLKIPYGVCEVNQKNMCLNKITEKPEYNFFVNTGLYVIKKNVLKFLPLNQSIDMNEYINILLKKNKNIGIYPISEKGWIDIGEWKQYKISAENFKEIFNK